MINRIKQVMEYKQMSPTTFADTIQINRSSLTHIFSGRNQPSLDIAKKILNAFPEVNTEWLIMGVGAMLKSTDNLVSESEAVPVKTVDNMLQTDLFGDVFDEDPATIEGSNEPVSAPVAVQPVSQMDADMVSEPEYQSQPEPEMPVEPKTIPTPRRIQKPSESKNSTSGSRRDKNLNSQHDKKIEKIIFFYEDNSFEIFRPNV